LAVLSVVLLINSRAALAEKRALAELVLRKAAVLENEHIRLSRRLVNFAQDRVFGHYMKAPPDLRNDAKAEMHAKSLGLQKDTAVYEMCFIDEHGHEVMRFIDGIPRYDLSTNEISNAFFGVGFKLDAKQVSPPQIYVSPDAQQWVVGYVTPIFFDERKIGLLHYEYKLSKFVEGMTFDFRHGSDEWASLVDDEGYIIWDTREPTRIAHEQRSIGGKKIDNFKKMSSVESAAIALGTEGEGKITENGVTWMVVYKPVLGWTVVVGRRL
ncbi:MAG: hypothetical protein ABT940_13190, partial [Alphaproteobacteria bacterium]